MFVIYKVYTSTTPLHTTPHKVKNFQSEKENQYLGRWFAEYCA